MDPHHPAAGHTGRMQTVTGECRPWLPLIHLPTMTPRTSQHPHLQQQLTLPPQLPSTAQHCSYLSASWVAQAPPKAGGPTHSRPSSSNASPLATRSAPAATTGNAVHGARERTPSHKSVKKTYFEYAKDVWETDHDFQMPGNLGPWVLVARPGNPEARDRGIVYCKLCLHYRRVSAFTKGYK